MITVFPLFMQLSLSQSCSEAKVSCCWHELEIRRKNQLASLCATPCSWNWELVLKISHPKREESMKHVLRQGSCNDCMEGQRWSFYGYFFVALHHQFASMLINTEGICSVLFLLFLHLALQPWTVFEAQRALRAASQKSMFRVKERVDEGRKIKS